MAQPTVPVSGTIHVTSLTGDEQVVLFGAGAGNVTTTTQDIANLGGGSGSGVSVRSVSGATDTILAADKGNIVYYTSASAVTVTVPVGLGAAFNCLIIQGGAGTVTVQGDGTSTVERAGHLATANQWAICSLVSAIANTIIFGGATS